MKTYWNGCNHPPKGADQGDLERHAESKAQHVLTLLWDLRWHNTKRLLDVGGHRFGAALLILRKSGWAIETETYLRDDGHKGFRYRLTSHTPGLSEGSRVRIYASYRDARSAANGMLTIGMVDAAKEAVSC